MLEAMVRGGLVRSLELALLVMSMPGFLPHRLWVCTSRHGVLLWL